MKRCSRCGCASLDVIRETTSRRGRREYLLSWYACPSCQEVNFSYRLIHVPGPIEPWDLPPTEPDPIREPAPTV